MGRQVQGHPMDPSASGSTRHPAPGSANPGRFPSARETALEHAVDLLCRVRCPANVCGPHSGSGRPLWGSYLKGKITLPGGCAIKGLLGSPPGTRASWLTLEHPGSMVPCSQQDTGGHPLGVRESDFVTTPVLGHQKYSCLEWSEAAMTLKDWEAALPQRPWAPEISLLR